jgi:hypothetical protein
MMRRKKQRNSSSSEEESGSVQISSPIKTTPLPKDDVEEMLPTSRKDNMEEIMRNSIKSRVEAEDDDMKPR